MAEHKLNVQLQIKRDSSASWTSKDPILLGGELGLEIDSGRLKIGDGQSTWEKLPYITLSADELKQLEEAFETIATLESAIDNKADKIHTHTPEDIKGVLNEDQLPAIPANKIEGIISSENLPSYVDDVIEYETTFDFPPEGESGKIYISKTTNLTYRWSGSDYVEISPSLALGTTGQTAFRGDYGQTAYNHSQIVNGNPHGVTKDNIGLDKVENKSSFEIRSEITASNINTALTYVPQKQLYHQTLDVGSGIDWDTLEEGWYSIVGGYGVSMQEEYHQPVYPNGNRPTSSGTLLVFGSTDGKAQIYYPGVGTTGEWSQPLHRIFNGAQGQWTTWYSIITSGESISFPIPIGQGGTGVSTVEEFKLLYTPVATEDTDGLISATDKAKLDNIQPEANKYVHPTEDGWRHLPAGGTDGQLIKRTSNDGYEWVDDKDIGSAEFEGYTRLYPELGENEDGALTQKAAKEESNRLESLITKTKTDLAEQITAADNKIDSTKEGLEEQVNSLKSSLENKISDDIDTAKGDITKELTSKITEIQDTLSSSIEEKADKVHTHVPIDITGVLAENQIPNISATKLVGIIPTENLPSYVDDVIEADSQTNFPPEGEAGKIYVAIDTNLAYRWSGSQYVEISPSIALGITSRTAFRGDLGQEAYTHSQITNGNPHNTTKADIGLDNVDNKSFSEIEDAITTTVNGTIEQTKTDLESKITSEISSARAEITSEITEATTELQGNLDKTKKDLEDQIANAKNPELRHMILSLGYLFGQAFDLTAAEYDRLKLSAQEYDEKEISAYDHDLDGRYAITGNRNYPWLPSSVEYQEEEID